MDTKRGLTGSTETLASREDRTGRLNAGGTSPVGLPGGGGSSG
ncbi:hypothetical protein [Geomonas propionica]|nr:hypothetical protein [Geomonas propionica]